MVLTYTNERAGRIIDDITTIVICFTQVGISVSLADLPYDQPVLREKILERSHITTRIADKCTASTRLDFRC